MGRARSTTSAVASRPRTSTRGRARAATRPTALEVLLGRDFQYAVSVDYNSYENERDPNCECDGIHRCSVITGNIAIEPDIDFWRIAELWQPQTAREKYGAIRLLAGAALTADDFEVNVRRGYYGQEIGSIHLGRERASELDQQWQEFLKLAEDKQVPYLLEREYGYLLPALKDKTFVAEKIATKLLVFGATDHYTSRLHRPAVASYRNMLSHDRLASRRRQEPVPLGVVAPDEDHYRVIDGYHRLRAAQESELKAVTVWVARSPQA